MNEKRFSSQLLLIVPKVVELIVEKTNLDEVQATEALYASQLYSRLEDEQTKLWHLSPFALYDLFAEERKTGAITYPEEA